MKNTKTTCASKLLEAYESPFDATVIRQCAEHQLIPIGKVNMDEFAMGSSTENSAFFTTKNPWDTSCVPGGSSGGSAAAVAAGFAPLSLGSDTGGSIRQPAAFCGVVGIKPTYGRVSRYGLVAFASSLDQIGPFSRTVEDSAHLLNVICGFDRHDSTSANKDVPDFSKALTQDIKGLKIGVPSIALSDKFDSKIKENLIQALDQLKACGASWKEIDFQPYDIALSAYYILASAEASSNLARFDGVRYSKRANDVKNIKEMYKKSRGEGFGKEVKRRIILGTYALSSGYYDAFYLKAQKARTLVINEYNRVFKDVDVIMSPTTPTPSFKIGENSANPLKMHLQDLFTIPTNLAGIPAASIPSGFIDGLPVGLHIQAKAFDEQTLLKVADTFQHATDHHTKTPENLS